MTFLNFLISGISLGSIYAIIALGYTMVYGIAKMLNFAHGDVIMVGAYICFYAVSRFDLPPLAGVILAMLVCTVLGMVVERLAYKPLRQAPSLAVLITAIGVSYFLQNMALLLWSSNPKVFPGFFASASGDTGVELFGGQLKISYVIMVTIAACIVIMLALTWFTGKTKLGKAMRAASFDVETAQLMGINADRVISFTFCIGSALAAAAGVLVGVYYNSIDPLMGIMPGLKAFVAAVLGGIGILPGAVAGGIILGVIEALVSGFISSTFRDAAAFAILILVLLFKPSGLFGKNTREKV